MNRWQLAVLIPWSAAVLAAFIIGYSPPVIDLTLVLLVAGCVAGGVKQLQVHVGGIRVSPAQIPFTALMAISGPTSAALVSLLELVITPVRWCNRWWNMLMFATLGLTGGWAFHVLAQHGGGVHACSSSGRGSCAAFLGWALAIYVVLEPLNFLMLFAGNLVPNQNPTQYRMRTLVHQFPAQIVSAPLFGLTLLAWAQFGAPALIFAGFITAVLMVLQARLLESEHREHMLVELTDELKRQRESALASVLTAMSSRDRLEALHVQRTSELAEMCARELGLQDGEREQLRIAALLHDVGKLTLPDALLYGDRSEFSEEEAQMIRSHPPVGAAQLEQIPALRDVAEIVRCHHERPDGRGYPQGLTGDQIPLASRIIAVCSAYDELSSAASYQLPSSVQETRRRLRDGAGTRFDAHVIDALISALARTEPIEQDHNAPARAPSPPPAAATPRTFPKLLRAFGRVRGQTGEKQLESP